MTIVAAYPVGSPDIPSSRDRIKEYTETLRGMGVEIVDSMDALLERVDVVLIESVDGRPHLAAGQTGDRRRQAAVHRQTDGRFAGRRHADLPSGQGEERALFFVLVAAVRRRARRKCETARRTSARSTAARPGVP